MGYKRSYSKTSSKKDCISSKHELSNGKFGIPPRILAMNAGDVSHKFEVSFPEYRMSVFIDDPSGEKATRERITNMYKHS